MKIGGLQKFSLIDYPGRLSAIVFAQGCNMNCAYCHNPELVDPDRFQEPLDDSAVLSFLKERKGRLDGVIVTGGEPTIHSDLADFLERVKKMGYDIKLDTNGSRPDVLVDLIKRNLVDYFALDVKAPWEKYHLVTQSDIDPDLVRQSIDIVRQSERPYEFRTTIVAEQLGREDIMAIGRAIKGADRYVLQPFVSPGKVVGRRFRGCHSYELSELESWAVELKEKYVKNCFVR